ncbi:HAD family hydrolase [Desulfurococcus amylolyticus]|uniref:Predicted hydrolase (HAD superfamily) n=2 Tax=Desulfurococcus TaxID=2273 RepID=B8D2Y2_DESA1|nr:HAD family hydrolase [Desulfurococcus amylolyticus]ACL10529.1 Predicted hydrolase (HAD superfamily) [Desulfurococcus amylolyticus 1221n]
MAGCLAISFDIWGTLVDLDKTLDHLSEIASNRLGLSIDEARKAIYVSHEEARKLRRFTPNIPPLELIARGKEIIAAKLSTSLNTVDSILMEAFTTVEPGSIIYPDVIPVLSKLHDEGIYMGVVGNVLFWPSVYTMIILDKTGLSKYFRVAVFSDIIGYSKPDREIFLEFAKISGFEPNRVIHVGDNVIEDVGGALSSGFLGVLINRRSNRSIYVWELNAAVINDMRNLVDLYREASLKICRK